VLSFEAERGFRLRSHEGPLSTETEAISRSTEAIRSEAFTNRLEKAAEKSSVPADVVASVKFFGQSPAPKISKRSGGDPMSVGIFVSVVLEKPKVHRNSPKKDRFRESTGALVSSFGPSDEALVVAMSNLLSQASSFINAIEKKLYLSLCKDLRNECKQATN